MDIYELIKSRRSPRGFFDKSISEEELSLMFDAAHWAASSYNSQPWRFIYADKEKNPELYNLILDLMVEFNKTWAKATPVLIVAMITTKHPKTGETLSHAKYDLGLAVGNMTIMAQSLGISLHNIGGFDQNKAREVLNLPDKIEPITIIAAGYGGLPGNLPLDIYKMEIMPRERLEINEIVFNKIFDKE
ncbi:MAG: nitroreductase [Bacteroidales bacterium]|jgi:nitroreductase|nr:nitroreductase family protein [Bacteroidales bacterium]MCK9499604.1 nitroreductase family protein [Bacteroidales bacterium]MDY0314479.1 nitroreductase family protein [Bacteroidales bacterium]NLB85696.1 nitroreductase [Bacteroidales bacterium]